LAATNSGDPKRPYFGALVRIRILVFSKYPCCVLMIAPLSRTFQDNDYVSKIPPLVSIFMHTNQPIHSARCTCPGESHPGPVHPDGSYVGRAAPEIDVFEATVEHETGLVGLPLARVLFSPPALTLILL